MNNQPVCRVVGESYLCKSRESLLMEMSYRTYVWMEKRTSMQRNKKSERTMISGANGGK
jgi:hypothetical protein